MNEPSADLNWLSASDEPGQRNPARDQWRGVEVRHLEALAAIAREGSFREAAEALGYVQSAVSQQIAQLERLVGTRLIERERGSAPVTLTDAGRLLLEHVDEILARYHDAQAELVALAQGLAGRLRVGMTPSVAVHLLPRLLRDFGERAPGVQVLPTEDATDARLLDALANGDLDLALCELPLPAGPFAATDLLADPLVLVVAADGLRGRSRRAVAAAELDDLELVGHRRWPGHERALRWLAEHGSRPRIVSSAESDATVQSLVAAGVGAALAPYLAVDAADPETTVRAIEGAPPRTIALVRHRDREPAPAAEAFGELALAASRRLADEIAVALTGG